MSKRTAVIAVITALTIACLLPIALDVLVFGSKIPSNISNGDWASFLGGYIGAIVGAAISLIGITATILHTKDENKKDRALQVRPHLQFKYQYKTEYTHNGAVVGRLVYSCKPLNADGIGWDVDSRACCLILIKNVGMGPAIDFRFSGDLIEDGRDHGIVLACTADRACDVNSLSPGEEGSFPIAIECNFDLIPKDAIIGEGLSGGPNFKYLNKYKSHDIVLHMSYKDILGHSFSHDIKLHVSIGATQKEGGEWKHAAEVHLMEVTPVLQ